MSRGRLFVLVVVATVMVAMVDCRLRAREERERERAAAIQKALDARLPTPTEMAETRIDLGDAGAGDFPDPKPP